MRLRQSTASQVVTFMAYLSSDHISVATGKTISVTISKNGGAFGNPNAGSTNATEISNGLYKVTLDATDTATEGPLDVKGTNADIDTAIKQCWVEAAGTVDTAAIADAVWDEALSGHTTAGTAGKKLGDQTNGPDANAIADQVWDEALSGHTTAGSAGKKLGDLALSADIADAVWDEAISGHLSAGSTGEALNDAGSAGTPPTAAEVADAVWDEALAGHLSAGSTGEALSDAGAAGTPPTAAEVADAVWDEAIAGHLGAGTTGEKLNDAGAAGDPWNTALPGSYGAGTAGKIVGDNLDATISSRLASAGITLVGGKVTPIDIEGMTFTSVMESIMAVLFGVTDVSGAVSGATVTFMKRDGTTGKVTITYGSVNGKRDTSSVV